MFLSARRQRCFILKFPVSLYKIVTKLIYSISLLDAEPVNIYKKPDAPVNSSPKYEILLLSLLAIVVILIYADTLTTPFILDDIHNIRDNPHIRVPSLSLKNLIRAGFQSPESKPPGCQYQFCAQLLF